MELTNVNSKDELLQKLLENEKNYVLIYKSGSEQSDCAFNNIAKINGLNDLYFYVVDVNKIKDIHTHFSVSSAPTLLEFHKDKMTKTVKGCNEPNFYKSFITNTVAVVNAQGESKTQKKVTVYSTPTCSWCTRLKKYLDQNGIKYRDIDVSKDQKAAEELVKRSGQQGVPQTDINGQIIVGFDKQKIDKLLDIKS